MKRTVSALLLAGMVCFSQGCATLSEDECLTADWWIVGQKDGTEGEPASILAEHWEACAEHGVKPDRKSYAEGRQSGLQVYCTRFNGYKIGRNDDDYHRVCTGSLAKSFETGLSRGKQVRGIEMEIWGIKLERKKLRKKIGELEKELEAQHARFESDESAPEDREGAWARIGEIDHELEKLGLEYEESAQKQTDAKARLGEAAEQARNDGYPDDGGLLQTYQNIKSLGEAFD